jgi:hypothetical protein
VLYNTFDLCGNGAAQGIIVEGHHWLIDGNTFSRLEDGIALYGDHHVVRNNHFGPLSVADVGAAVHPDAMESSCAGDYPLVRMLWENNVVQSWGPDDSNAHTFLMRDTQNCGQSDNVVRFSVTVNTGSYWNVLSDNVKNFRAYNNSISHTQQALGAKDYEDVGPGTNSTGTKFINNIIADTTKVSGDGFCYWMDASSLPGFVANHNLCWVTGQASWQVPISGYSPSDLFNKDPKFVDPLADLHLQAGSPAIQAGGPLSVVANTDSGSGTSLAVTDAGFFQDGYGIPTVQADWIRVGPTAAVQIASIDYNTNTITLATPISRSPGDPVYLYKDSTGRQVLLGSAPDIGAYQFTGGGGGDPQAPSAPKGLRVR